MIDLQGTSGLHSATFLSAPYASSPVDGSQSAAAGCLLPPVEMYLIDASILWDTKPVAFLDRPSTLSCKVFHHGFVLRDLEKNLGFGLIDKGQHLYWFVMHNAQFSSQIIPFVKVSKFFLDSMDKAFSKEDEGGVTVPIVVEFT